MPSLTTSQVFEVLSLVFGPQERRTEEAGMDVPEVPQHIETYVRYELDQIALYLIHAALGRCPASKQPISECDECRRSVSTMRSSFSSSSFEEALERSPFGQGHRSDRNPHGHEFGEAILARIQKVKKLYGALA